MIGRRRIALFARTLPRLGYGHAAIVAGYRFAKNRGWLDRPGLLVNGILFHAVGSATGNPHLAHLMAQELDELRASRLRMLGQDAVPVESPPDWRRNRLSGAIAQGDRPWWQANDFDSALGDIKGVWELSRFDWALSFARAAVATGEGDWLGRLIAWSSDWMARNPAYRGPNWMCGQETSIRLLQVLLAARLLGQEKAPAPALVDFSRAHLARIALTRLYADAQDNNHATSEAVALYAGGAWLAGVSAGSQARQARAWSDKGRRWLERLARRLILPDGGFSQYSLNYHRLALDGLCQAEVWRRHLRLTAFSAHFNERCGAMTRWLAAMVNANSGDAPMLGANDGAYAFRLSGLPYRDYRPSVQLAAHLFCNARAYPPGPWDEPLAWLSLDDAVLDETLARKCSRWFPQSGVALLNPRGDGSGDYALVRVPVARFRPSQADPLHFDLWRADGQNLLRDGGSGSYFDADALSYFTGIASHNTIQFDGREPMPRLSRFLFGDWIAGAATDPQVSVQGLAWQGCYRDRHGVHHARAVRATGNLWNVEDRIGGFRDRALLRWRLMPGLYTLEGNRFEHPSMCIVIESDIAPLHLRVVEGREARAYGAWTSLPCLEAEFGPGTRLVRSHLEIGPRS